MTDDSSSRGFSLIELLVVVAVIAIIAGIAIPQCCRRASAPTKAPQSRRSQPSALRSPHSQHLRHGGFAQSLKDLARPPAGATQSFISEPLGANGVIRSGYVAVSPDLGAMVVTPAPDLQRSARRDVRLFRERHPNRSASPEAVVCDRTSAALLQGRWDADRAGDGWRVSAPLAGSRSAGSRSDSAFRSY